MEILYFLFVLTLAIKLIGETNKINNTLKVGGNPTLRRVENVFSKRYENMIKKFGPVKGVY